MKRNGASRCSRRQPTLCVRASLPPTSSPSRHRHALHTRPVVSPPTMPMTLPASARRRSPRHAAVDAASDEPMASTVEELPPSAEKPTTAIDAADKPTTTDAPPPPPIEEPTTPAPPPPTEEDAAPSSGPLTLVDSTGRKTFDCADVLNRLLSNGLEAGTLPRPAPSPFPRPVLSPYNLGALDGTPNDDRARGRQAGAFPEDLALDARNAAPPVYSALPPSAISKRRRRRAL